LIDDLVTTALEAIALLAVAAGVGLVVAGPRLAGAGLVAGGLVLIGSTSLLGWVASRADARAEKRARADEPGEIRA